MAHGARALGLRVLGKAGISMGCFGRNGGPGGTSATDVDCMKDDYRGAFRYSYVSFGWGWSNASSNGNKTRDDLKYIITW